MFCLFIHQAKIQICCTVKLISWNVVNLSHLYLRIWGLIGVGNPLISSNVITRMQTAKQLGSSTVTKCIIFTSFFPFALVQYIFWELNLQQVFMVLYDNRWGYYWKCLFIKLCDNGCGFPTKGFLRLDLTSSEGTKACLITKHTMIRFVKYHLEKGKIVKKWQNITSSEP